MATINSVTKDVAMEHVEAAPHQVNEEELNVASKGDEDQDPPAAEQRRILRTIDLRVTVVTGALFFISIMDRTNLGAASIAGMTRDLQLNIDNRYNLVALMFFIPYVVFEFPGAVFARLIGPRIFLGSICTLWGIVMLCFGFVTNWGQLVGLRLLLGLFEAGYFPACIFLLSTYYTRYEVQKRYGVFYLIATVTSAFAGILAYGLMQMDGIGGKAGWRWIFIMEGILTVIIGLLGLAFLVDFPDKAARSFKFLTQAEAEWVIRRIERDRGDGAPEPFSIWKFLNAGRDLRLWCFSLIFLCLTTVSYSVAFFLPIILNRQMGFSVAASQCLVAPPYVFAGMLMLACGWAGDKYRIRGPLVIMNAVICIVGLVVMTWPKSAGVRYFGTFLVTAGVNANVPCAMAYQANNIRGQWTRAFGSATLVAGGGLGGVSGSLIFRTQDAPRYLNGIYGCIVANVLIILIVVGFTVHFVKKNRLARQGKIVIQGQEGFYYTL